MIALIIVVVAVGLSAYKLGRSDERLDGMTREMFATFDRIEAKIRKQRNG